MLSFLIVPFSCPILIEICELKSDPTFIPVLGEYIQKYDTETLLTRMLLKGMIEYLSSQVKPGSLEAAMVSL